MQRKANLWVLPPVVAIAVGIAVANAVAVAVGVGRKLMASGNGS